MVFVTFGNVELRLEFFQEEQDLVIGYCLAHYSSQERTHVKVNEDFSFLDMDKDP